MDFSGFNSGLEKRSTNNCPTSPDTGSRTKLAVVPARTGRNISEMDGARKPVPNEARASSVRSGRKLMPIFGLVVLSLGEVLLVPAL